MNSKDFIISDTDVQCVETKNIVTQSNEDVKTSDVSDINNNNDNLINNTDIVNDINKNDDSLIVEINNNDVNVDLTITEENKKNDIVTKKYEIYKNYVSVDSQVYFLFDFFTNNSEGEIGSSEVIKLWINVDDEEYIKVLNLMRSKELGYINLETYYNKILEIFPILNDKKLKVKDCLEDNNILLKDLKRLLPFKFLNAVEFEEWCKKQEQNTLLSDFLSSIFKSTIFLTRETDTKGKLDGYIYNTDTTEVQLSEEKNLFNKLLNNIGSGNKYSNISFDKEIDKVPMSLSDIFLINAPFNSFVSQIEDWNKVALSKNFFIINSPWEAKLDTVILNMIKTKDDMMHPLTYYVASKFLILLQYKYLKNSSLDLYTHILGNIKFSKKNFFNQSQNDITYIDLNADNHDDFYKKINSVENFAEAKTQRFFTKHNLLDFNVLKSYNERLIQHENLEDCKKIDVLKSVQNTCEQKNKDKITCSSWDNQNILIIKKIKQFEEEILIKKDLSEKQKIMLLFYVYVYFLEILNCINQKKEQEIAFTTFYRESLEPVQTRDFILNMLDKFSDEFLEFINDYNENQDDYNAENNMVSIIDKVHYILWDVMKDIKTEKFSSVWNNCFKDETVYDHKYLSIVHDKDSQSTLDVNKNIEKKKLSSVIVPSKNWSVKFVFYENKSITSTGDVVVWSAKNKKTTRHKVNDAFRVDLCLEGYGEPGYYALIRDLIEVLLKQFDSEEIKWFLTKLNPELFKLFLESLDSKKKHELLNYDLELLKNNKLDEKRLAFVFKKFLMNDFMLELNQEKIKLLDQFQVTMFEYAHLRLGLLNLDNVNKYEVIGSFFYFNTNDSSLFLSTPKPEHHLFFSSLWDWKCKFLLNNEKFLSLDSKQKIDSFIDWTDYLFDTDGDFSTIDSTQIKKWNNNFLNKLHKNAFIRDDNYYDWIKKLNYINSLRSQKDFLLIQIISLSIPMIKEVIDVLLPWSIAMTKTSKSWFDGWWGYDDKCKQLADFNKTLLSVKEFIEENDCSISSVKKNFIHLQRLMENIIELSEFCETMQNDFKKFLDSEKKIINDSILNCDNLISEELKKNIIIKFNDDIVFSSENKNNEEAQKQFNVLKKNSDLEIEKIFQQYKQNKKDIDIEQIKAEIYKIKSDVTELQRLQSIKADFLLITEKFDEKFNYQKLLKLNTQRNINVEKIIENYHEYVDIIEKNIILLEDKTCLQDQYKEQYKYKE